MNRNGNTYTVIYAAIMVVFVAALLAFASMSLKPRQVRNVEIQKKQSILSSVNIESTTANAEKLYADKIVKQYVVNVKGEQVDGDAFNIDLKKEFSKPEDKIQLPVFECKTDDGLKYIFELRGTGLWGPIWGFISLDADMNTIYGANFGHQGETPGLGAEIATVKFEKQFNGKTIFDKNGEFMKLGTETLPILVAKVGQNAPAEHKVDGISGGTITSKGLQQMLKVDFTRYEQFIKKNKS